MNPTFVIELYNFIDEKCRLSTERGYQQGKADTNRENDGITKQSQADLAMQIDKMHEIIHTQKAEIQKLMTDKAILVAKLAEGAVSRLPALGPKGK